VLAVLGRYWQVAKPGIVGGNLIAVAGGFLLASGGHAPAGPLLATIAGMALVIASACVLNNCLDRDLDRRMARTRGRVLARGLMAPRDAAIYALVLGLAGLAVLVIGGHALAAAVALAGFAVYIGIYTVAMKRRSVHAPLAGSLAGACPPLAGYCAAGGRIDAGALILLLMFALWQMPHFYAIAVYRLDDYAAAGVPVLPVSKGVATTRRHIIAHVLAFGATALALGLAGYAGGLYLAVAAASAAAWLVLAWAYRPASPRPWARRLFVCSIVVICALSVMMAVDAAVPPPALSYAAR
jgi:protoheme IX farnesyltransferase